MCGIRFAIFAILLGFGTAADIAGAEEAEAWTALHAGRHVALMRHTDAPGGAGDPPGFRVDDCAAQRNLSAKGPRGRRKDRRAAQVRRDCGRKNPQLAVVPLHGHGNAAGTGTARSRADIWRCGRAERSKRGTDRRRAR
jgi:hypothetical protein